MTATQRVLFAFLWGHHRLTCSGCRELMVRRVACRLLLHRLIAHETGLRCTRCGAWA